MVPFEIGVAPAQVSLRPRLPAGRTVIVSAREPVTGVEAESAARTVKLKDVSLATAAAKPLMRPDAVSRLNPPGNAPAVMLQVYGAKPPEACSVKSYGFPPLVDGSCEVLTASGEGVEIVKAEAEEVPPPGVGLKTVTCAEPSAAMSVAGMAAVRRVLLSKVVVRFEPFHLTTELEMKFDPFTVNVKAGPPVFALVGEMEVTLG